MKHSQNLISRNWKIVWKLITLAVGGLLDLSADGLSDIDTLGHCDEYKCPGMSCHGYDW